MNNDCQILAAPVSPIFNHSPQISYSNHSQIIEVGVDNSLPIFDVSDQLLFLLQKENICGTNGDTLIENQLTEHKISYNAEYQEIFQTLSDLVQSQKKTYYRRPLEISITELIQFFDEGAIKDLYLYGSGAKKHIQTIITKLFNTLFFSEITEKINTLIGSFPHPQLKPQDLDIKLISSTLLPSQISDSIIWFLEKKEYETYQEPSLNKVKLLKFKRVNDPLTNQDIFTIVGTHLDGCPIDFVGSSPAESLPQKHYSCYGISDCLTISILSFVNQPIDKADITISSGNYYHLKDALIAYFTNKWTILNPEPASEHWLKWIKDESGQRSLEGGLEKRAINGVFSLKTKTKFSKDIINKLSNKIETIRYQLDELNEQLFILENHYNNCLNTIYEYFLPNYIPQEWSETLNRTTEAIQTNSNHYEQLNTSFLRLTTQMKQAQCYVKNNCLYLSDLLTQSIVDENPDVTFKRLLKASLSLLRHGNIADNTIESIWEFFYRNDSLNTTKTPYLVTIQQMIVEKKLPFSMRMSLIEIMCWIYCPSTLTYHDLKPVYKLSFLNNCFFEVNPIAALLKLKPTTCLQHQHLLLQFATLLPEFSKQSTSLVSPLITYAKSLDIDEKELTKTVESFLSDQTPFICYIGALISLTIHKTSPNLSFKALIRFPFFASCLNSHEHRHLFEKGLTTMGQQYSSLITNYWNDPSDGFEWLEELLSEETNNSFILEIYRHWTKYKIKSEKSPQSFLLKLTLALAAFEPNLSLSVYQHLDQNTVDINFKRQFFETISQSFGFYRKSNHLLSLESSNSSLKALFELTCEQLENFNCERVQEKNISLLEKCIKSFIAYLIQKKNLTSGYELYVQACVKKFTKPSSDSIITVFLQWIENQITDCMVVLAQTQLFINNKLINPKDVERGIWKTFCLKLEENLNKKTEEELLKHLNLQKKDCSFRFYSLFSKVNNLIFKQKQLLFWENFSLSTEQEKAEDLTQLMTFLEETHSRFPSDAMHLLSLLLDEVSVQSSDCKLFMYQNLDIYMNKSALKTNKKWPQVLLNYLHASCDFLSDKRANEYSQLVDHASSFKWINNNFNTLASILNQLLKWAPLSKKQLEWAEINKPLFDKDKWIPLENQLILDAQNKLRDPKIDLNNRLELILNYFSTSEMHWCVFWNELSKHSAYNQVKADKELQIASISSTWEKYASHFLSLPADKRLDESSKSIYYATLSLKNTLHPLLDTLIYQLDKFAPIAMLREQTRKTDAFSYAFLIKSAFHMIEGAWLNAINSHPKNSNSITHIRELETGYISEDLLFISSNDNCAALTKMDLYLANELLKLRLMYLQYVLKNFNTEIELLLSAWKLFAQLSKHSAADLEDKKNLDEKTTRFLELYLAQKEKNFDSESLLDLISKIFHIKSNSHQLLNASLKILIYTNLNQNDLSSSTFVTSLDLTITCIALTTKNNLHLIFNDYQQCIKHIFYLNFTSPKKNPELLSKLLNSLSNKFLLEKTEIHEIIVNIFLHIIKKSPANNLNELIEKNENLKYFIDQFLNSYTLLDVLLDRLKNNKLSGNGFEHDEIIKQASIFQLMMIFLNDLPNNFDKSNLKSIQQICEKIFFLYPIKNHTLSLKSFCTLFESKKIFRVNSTELLLFDCLLLMIDPDFKNTKSQFIKERIRKYLLSNYENKSSYETFKKNLDSTLLKVIDKLIDQKDTALLSDCFSLLKFITDFPSDIYFEKIKEITLAYIQLKVIPPYLINDELNNVLSTEKITNKLPDNQRLQGYYFTLKSNLTKFILKALLDQLDTSISNDANEELRSSLISTSCRIIEKEYIALAIPINIKHSKDFFQPLLRLIKQAVDSDRRTIQKLAQTDELYTIRLFKFMLRESENHTVFIQTYFDTIFKAHKNIKDYYELLSRILFNEQVFSISNYFNLPLSSWIPNHPLHKSEEHQFLFHVVQLTSMHHKKPASLYYQQIDNLIFPICGSHNNSMHLTIHHACLFLIRHFIGIHKERKIEKEGINSFLKCIKRAISNNCLNFNHIGHTWLSGCLMKIFGDEWTEHIVDWLPFILELETSRVEQIPLEYKFNAVWILSGYHLDCIGSIKDKTQQIAALTQMIQIYDYYQIGTDAFKKRPNAICETLFAVHLYSNTFRSTLFSNATFNSIITRLLDNERIQPSLHPSYKLILMMYQAQITTEDKLSHYLTLCENFSHYSQDHNNTLFYNLAYNLNELISAMIEFSFLKSEYFDLIFAVNQLIKTCKTHPFYKNKSSWPIELLDEIQMSFDISNPSARLHSKQFSQHLDLFRQNKNVNDLSKNSQNNVEEKPTEVLVGNILQLLLCDPVEFIDNEEDYLNKLNNHFDTKYFYKLDRTDLHFIIDKAGNIIHNALLNKTKKPWTDHIYYCDKTAKQLISILVWLEKRKEYAHLELDNTTAIDRYDIVREFLLSYYSIDYYSIDQSKFPDSSFALQPVNFLKIALTSLKNLKSETDLNRILYHTGLLIIDFIQTQNLNSDFTLSCFLNDCIENYLSITDRPFDKLNLESKLISCVFLFQPPSSKIAQELGLVYNFWIYFEQLEKENKNTSFKKTIYPFLMAGFFACYSNIKNDAFNKEENELLKISLDQFFAHLKFRIEQNKLPFNNPLIAHFYPLFSARCLANFPCTETAFEPMLLHLLAGAKNLPDDQWKFYGDLFTKVYQNGFLCFDKNTQESVKVFQWVIQQILIILRVYPINFQKQLYDGWITNLDSSIIRIKGINESVPPILIKLIKKFSLERDLLALE